MTEPVVPVEVAEGPPVPNSGAPMADFDTAYQAFNTWEAGPLRTGMNALAAGAYTNTLLARAAVTTAVEKADHVDVVAAAVAVLAASAVTAPGTSATSTSSMTISTGAKSWTLDQLNKAFTPGQPFILADQADPTIQMAGILLTHNPATGACTGTVGSAQGAVGPHANWVMSLGVAALKGVSDLVRVPRTANIALVEADKGKWIDITAGSFNQTFGVRAVGWWCILGNSGSGDIGLTTDGVSYKMYPQEKRYVIFDGANDYTIVINGYSRAFVVSDTWVKAPGYKRHSGFAWSGGAGGQVGTDGSTVWYRMGGGGGMCIPFGYRASDLPASVAITIGAGGLYSATLVQNPGGATVFGSLFTVPGALGAVGAGYTAINTGGAQRGVGFAAPYTGGTAAASAQAGPGAEWAGGHGARGINTGTVVATGASGGDSIYGGGGGMGSGNTSSPGTGGKSMFGGNGGDSATPGGTAPGGGGAAFPNGHGARGEVRISGEI